MQLRITAILILGFLTVCSGTKETDTKIQNTPDLLVQKSPWTFDSYSLIKMVDKGNADVNDSLLKFWVYNNSENVKLTFKENGTGLFNDVDRNQLVTFKWTFIENNIEIKLDIQNSGTLNYNNVEITNDQLCFEKEDLGFDKEKNNVTFYGRYVYK